MLTHLTRGWLMAQIAPELKVCYYPFLSNSMHYHLVPLPSSHTHRTPFLLVSFSLQPESFLSEAWSSISVQSIVVMALLGAPLLRWCVSSCTISPLPVAFSLLGGPRIVHRCSADPPSQGANPINIQLERKITTAKIWEIKLGLDI